MVQCSIAQTFANLGVVGPVIFKRCIGKSVLKLCIVCYYLSEAVRQQCGRIGLATFAADIYLHYNMCMCACCKKNTHKRGKKEWRIG